MERIRFRPKTDKLFISLIIIINLLVAVPFAIALFFTRNILYMIIPLFLIVNYVFISSLFGYVELQGDSLFIKYGIFLKKKIPYDKIVSLKKEKKWYSESMLALKNAFEHVNIRYNKFDVTTVSVKDNDEFIEKLQKKIENS